MSAQQDTDPPTRSVWHTGEDGRRSSWYTRHVSFGIDNVVDTAAREIQAGKYVMIVAADNNEAVRVGALLRRALGAGCGDRHRIDNPNGEGGALIFPVWARPCGFSFHTLLLTPKAWETP